MTDNPYAPPKAPVADVTSLLRPTEIHGNVIRACQLLWASYATGVIAYVLRLLGIIKVIEMPYGRLFMTLGIGVGALITWWYTVKLKAGRNWMRLLITIFTALWIVWMAVMLLSGDKAVAAIYKQNPGQAVVSAVQALIGISVLVLINTAAARAWFYAMKYGASGAEPPSR